MHSVLIVDDDTDTREALQECLALAQYAVRTAASGAEAVAALREDPDCCVVLLDYRMPGMDGFDCLRTLRADPALARLRVILMSADGISVQDAHDAGADLFIQKPIDPGVLTTIVAQQCRRRGTR